MLDDQIKRDFFLPRHPYRQLTSLHDQMQTRGRELLAKPPRSRPDTAIFYSVWDTFCDQVGETCARPVPEIFHDYVKEQLEEAERILSDVIAEETEVNRPLTEATARVRSGFEHLKSLLPELRDQCTDAKGRPLRKKVERICTAFEEFALSMRNENQIVIARTARRSDRQKHTQHACISHLDQCWRCLKPPSQQIGLDGNYDPWRGDHVSEWRKVVSSCESAFVELFPPPPDRTRRVPERPSEKPVSAPTGTVPELSSDADALIRRLRREIRELKRQVEQLQKELEEARAHGQEVEGRLQEFLELPRKVVTLTEDLMVHRDRERELLDRIDALERTKARLIAGLALTPAGNDKEHIRAIQVHAEKTQSKLRDRLAALTDDKLRSEAMYRKALKLADGPLPIEEPTDLAAAWRSQWETLRQYENALVDARSENERLRAGIDKQRDLQELLKLAEEQRNDLNAQLVEERRKAARQTEEAEAKHGEAVGDLMAKLRGAQKDIDVLKGQLAQQKDVIAKCARQKEQKRRLKQELEELRAALQKRKAAAEQLAVDLNFSEEKAKQLPKLKEKMTDLKQQLAAEKSAVEDHVRQLQQSRADLETETLTSAATIKQLRSEIQALNRRIALKDDEISDLISKLNALSAQLQELEGKTAKATPTIQNLQHQLGLVTSELELKDQRIASLQKEIEEMDDGTTALRSQLDQERKAKADLRLQITRLEQKAPDPLDDSHERQLQEQIRKAARELAQSRALAESLQEQLDESERRRAKLRSEHARIQRAVGDTQLSPLQPRVAELEQQLEESRARCNQYYDELNQFRTEKLELLRQLKVLEVAAHHFDPLEDSISRFQFVRDEHARLRKALSEADPSHETIVVDGEDRLRQSVEREIEDLEKEHCDLEKRLIEASLHEQLRQCHITRECMEELSKDLSAAHKRIHTWREHALKLKRENRALLEGAKGEATPAAELEATVMDLQEQLGRVEERLVEYESQLHLPRKATADLGRRIQRLGSMAVQASKLPLWDRNGKSLLVADTEQPQRRSKLK